MNSPEGRKRKRKPHYEWEAMMKGGHRFIMVGCQHVHMVGDLRLQRAWKLVLYPLNICNVDKKVGSKFLTKLNGISHLTRMRMKDLWNVWRWFQPVVLSEFCRVSMASPESCNVLIICCYITNHPKFSALKQQPKLLLTRVLLIWVIHGQTCWFGASSADIGCAYSW